MQKKEQNALEGCEYILALDPGINLGYALIVIKTKQLAASGTLTWNSVDQLVNLFFELKEITKDAKVLVITEDCYVNNKNSVESSLTFGKRIAIVSAMATIVFRGFDNIKLYAVSPNRWVSAMHLNGSSKAKRVAKVAEALEYQKQVSEHEADAILMAAAVLKNRHILAELKH